MFWELFNGSLKLLSNLYILNLFTCINTHTSISTVLISTHRRFKMEKNKKQFPIHNKTDVQKNGGMEGTDRQLDEVQTDGQTGRQP